MRKDYCDGQGHYCAVGWVMHTIGISDADMVSMDIEDVAAELGLMTDEDEEIEVIDVLEAVTEYNDIANTHVEAVESIKGVLLNG
jgi:hypothetical protein